MRKYLCLIDTADRQYLVKSAVKELREGYGVLLEAYVFSPIAIRVHKEAYEQFKKAIKECEFAVIYFHGGSDRVPEFKELYREITEKMPCYYSSAVAQEISEYLPTSHIDPKQYKALSEFFNVTIKLSYCNFFLSIESIFFQESTKLLSFTRPASQGLYQTGKGILSSQEEMEYLDQLKKDTKPVIGVLIHSSNILTQNMMAIDALIEELKAQGMHPLCVFSSLAVKKETKEGFYYVMDSYFKPDGKVLVKAIITTIGFSFTGSVEKGSRNDYVYSIFERYQVAVIKALTTHFSYQEFMEKPQGVDSMSLASNVFQPEMDGQIMSVPFAVWESIVMEGVERKLWVAIPERVHKICCMAANWAKLYAMRNDKKKVAVIFHNQPGNHNIGRGEGLDTFESVSDLLKQMQANGYQVTPYANGQQLSNCLLKGLTNDTRFLSESMQKERACGTLDAKLFTSWVDSFNGQNKENLKEYWGECPGTVMCDGKEILIPGLINQNVFIGIQPSRAWSEQAAQIYHSAVFPPPYSYLGFYRWVEEVFHADVIVHVGTHGSLEWLPGKEAGLSKNCYPDLCLYAIPHLYIYNMGIVGEGIQAKRRSAAVIIEHLPPSMTDAGVYDALAEVDSALKDYAIAVNGRNTQKEILMTRILMLAKKANLFSDLSISEKEVSEEPEQCVTRIHEWVEELKNSTVTDGLHILGRPYKEKLLENMIRSLLRVRNGSVLPIVDAVLIAWGYEPKKIKEQKFLFFKGKQASVLLEEAVTESKCLIKMLQAIQYDTSKVDEILGQRGFFKGMEELKKVLTFICEEIYPKLSLTTKEMDYLLEGMSGRFVTCGLGGNPTRGNVSLLPSGRNFYAGDPEEIPSRGALEVGKKLAEQTIALHKKEKGCYPESVAIVIWSGNVLKSQGEDFGEIFTLMGVEPIYLKETSKVLGVKAIPLKELKRPRIDVTLRISGLFRDMYPNLITLMDQAVTMVASLDESEDENYIKKHINEDMVDLIEQGVCIEEAKDQASLRVFGCPPGGYGAGVSNVIANKNWESYEDLAKAYETFSGYAYNKKNHGTNMVAMFKKRLKTVSVTIKNETTVEIDLLSSDDFFSYHGGLIACVRANSGQTPLSIGGHTDDIDAPVIRDVASETARIMRSRILNPKWLNGLKRHGFKGAQEIAKAIDSYFGWDATAQVGNDAMYSDVMKQFLEDKETLSWIKEVNLGVAYHLSEVLLEANQRGMFHATKDQVNQLQKIFLETEGELEDNEI